MRSLLFVFDPRADRTAVIKAVGVIPDIENWNAFFGNTMILASRSDSRSLSKAIRQSLPGLKFLVTEAHPDENGGWLPRALWTFLNDPHPVGTADQAADA